jgi:hypothetical protein
MAGTTENLKMGLPQALTAKVKDRMPMMFMKMPTEA